MTFRRKDGTISDSCLYFVKEDLANGNKVLKPIHVVSQPWRRSTIELSRCRCRWLLFCWIVAVRLFTADLRLCFCFGSLDAGTWKRELSGSFVIPRLKREVNNDVVG